MADNNFKGTVEALFHGMDGVFSSKTVVGDAIHIGDTIIFPWWMCLSPWGRALQRRSEGEGSRRYRR